MAPVVRRIPTDKPYVFLTIDDGEIKDPAAVELAKRGWPTLFLNEKYFKDDAAYFTSLNAPVEDHTVDHPNLRGKPYEFQREEICDDADAEQRAFGVRPTLFRPPFGNYDDNTRRAAAACGLKAVVLWDETINNGAMQFQVGHHLRPGDIVLMHFRKTFTEDYQAFLDQVKADGLTPARLPDFLS
ncbi:polysaccharide deacetylase family protein [Actinokineospora bangkokensis]|nr:polysaccharide deacetylase family protein [Actinokineospora bangkokensis]